MVIFKDEDIGGVFMIKQELKIMNNNIIILDLPDFSDMFFKFEFI